jgi:hypothetical protein
MPPWFNWRSVPPEILIGWFAIMVPFLVGWLIWAAVDASALTILSFAALTVFVGSQAAIYAPRAWRAYKEGESGGWKSGWPWRSK